MTMRSASSSCCPASNKPIGDSYAKNTFFSIEHTLVDGGDTRFASSCNGLRAIPDEEEGIVGIHDGVRPFVSTEVIRRCYDKARHYGAVIPVLPVTDTLRLVGEDGSGRNVLRSNYRIVQTPQVFDLQLLKRAFQQPWQPQFTDDASVVEALGHKVEMTEGNHENIKITTPFDLETGEMIVQRKLESE